MSKKVQYVGIGAAGQKNKDKLLENSIARTQPFRGKTVFVPKRDPFSIALENLSSTSTSSFLRKAFEKGEYNERVFYDAMGAWLVKKMKHIINSKTVLTPNAPATIDIKGFDWPLKDRGEMVNSLGHVVV